jgi:hypothetical protein
MRCVLSKLFPNNGFETSSFDLHDAGMTCFQIPCKAGNHETHVAIHCHISTPDGSHNVVSPSTISHGSAVARCAVIAGQETGTIEPIALFCSMQIKFGAPGALAHR